MVLASIWVSFSTEDSSCALSAPSFPFSYIRRGISQRLRPKRGPSEDCNCPCPAGFAQKASEKNETAAVPSRTPRMNSHATRSTKSPCGDSPPPRKRLRWRGWEPAQAGLAHLVARGFNRRVCGRDLTSSSSFEPQRDFVGKAFPGLRVWPWLGSPLVTPSPRAAPRAAARLHPVGCPETPSRRAGYTRPLARPAR